METSEMTTKVLVTGGAGYIGSHTCIELLAAGFDLLVLDNFCNSHPLALKRVERIARRPVALVRGDIRDRPLLDGLFREHAVSAVVHFAGLKAVGESVQQPLRYYDNNVGGTVHLLEAMAAAGVKRIVFSSSATVYGNPQRLPLTEDHPLSATNAYGRSKLVIEEILRDLYRSDDAWRVANLRYFNPVGAHESGLIGEDPQDIPNNLMPYISQVAVGRRTVLNVWGNDYPTPDGTGVRDYIHVVDLALGHLRALERLAQVPGMFTVNLGTGRGYSVLDMVRAFEKACERPVSYEIKPRRPGDVASCYADPDLAARLLGWRATRGLDEMCADTWRWQSLNPQGFEG
jgi:UDP-glucose 4-epimerase